MRAEPVIGEDRVGQLGRLLLILGHVDTGVENLVSEPGVLVFGLLGGLELGDLHRIHELVVLECLFIQEEIRRFNHEDTASKCRLSADSLLKKLHL